MSNEEPNKKLSFQDAIDPALRFSVVRLRPSDSSGPIADVGVQFQGKKIPGFTVKSLSDHPTALDAVLTATGYLIELGKIKVMEKEAPPPDKYGTVVLLTVAWQQTANVSVPLTLGSLYQLIGINYTDPTPPYASSSFIAMKVLESFQDRILQVEAIRDQSIQHLVTLQTKYSHSHDNTKKVTDLLVSQGRDLARIANALESYGPLLTTVAADYRSDRIANMNGDGEPNGDSRDYEDLEP